MCGWSRSAQVQAIGIMCTTMTALSALNLVKIAATGDVGYEFKLVYSGNYVLALSIQSLIFAFHIITYILLIFGSIKHNKVMLIPFMFITTLQSLLLCVLAVYFVYYGTFLSLILLIPVFITLGVTMYFLTAVVQFYREINKGNVSVEKPYIILHQPYNNNYT